MRRWLTRVERVSGCRQRQSGSMRRAVVWLVRSIRGGIPSIPVGRTTVIMLAIRRRSVSICRTGTGCTIWRVTCGSGALMSTTRISTLILRVRIRSPGRTVWMRLSTISQPLQPIACCAVARGSVIRGTCASPIAAGTFLRARSSTSVFVARGLSNFLNLYFFTPFIRVSGSGINEGWKVGRFLHPSSYLPFFFFPSNLPFLPFLPS